MLFCGRPLWRRNGNSDPLAAACASAWPASLVVISDLPRPATQRSYLHAVTKFSRYFGRSPDRLGLEDDCAFQVCLVSLGLSWPTLPLKKSQHEDAQPESRLIGIFS